METENKSCKNCKNCVKDDKRSNEIVEVYICYYKPLTSGNFMEEFGWYYPSILAPLEKHGQDCVGWIKRK